MSGLVILQPAGNDSKFFKIFFEAASQGRYLDKSDADISKGSESKQDEMMGDLINAHQHQFVTKKHTRIQTRSSFLLRLCFLWATHYLGASGWGGGGLSTYITDNLNKIFPCHYVQNLLEVDLLDTNQSDRSLIGAVCCCVQCACVCVCLCARVCACVSARKHIPERSIGGWSRSRDFDQQTSFVSTSSPIETTFLV